MADAGIKDTESQTGSPQTTGQRILEFISASDGSSGRWSFEFGVGIISDNKPIDYLDFNLHPLKGPGSGHTYNFTIARRIADFDWKVGNTIHLRPQIEVPFRLIIVDQQEGGVIPDVNLGVTFRWRNWPWNRIVATTFSIGVGLSYSSPVWTADIQRHQNQLPRSEVKFWMPLEFTFALPKYPNYQITAFGDHRSGGAIFDVGGIDAWGLGIRVVF